MGAVNLLSSVTPDLPERVVWLRNLYPVEIRQSAHLFTALSGFFLLILAASLLRRKRVAWLLTVGLLVLSILSHLIKGLDYEESLLAGGVLLPPPRLSPSFSPRTMPESLLALALACSSSIRSFLLVPPPFCLLSSCCCVRFFCGGNLRPRWSDDAPEPSLASMAILPWQTSPF